MKKKILGIFVCMLMIVTTLPAVCAVNVPTAWSVKEHTYSELNPSTPTNSVSLITIKIAAKVTYVYDPNNLLGGAIQVNDTITGKYTYDSGTPDTLPDPHTGGYLMNSSPCGFEVTVDKFVFKTNPSDVFFGLAIFNDWIMYGNPPADYYEVFSSKNLPLSNGMLVDWILWLLNDYNCTALSNDALPTTAPVLSDWESVVGLMLAGKDPSDPYKTFSISAHVTKATKTFAITLIFGRYANLAGEGRLITIEAVNLRLIVFNPFQFLHYTNGEKITFVKDTAKVMILPRFIIGILM